MRIELSILYSLALNEVNGHSKDSDLVTSPAKHVKTHSILKCAAFNKLECKGPYQPRISFLLLKHEYYFLMP